MIRKMIAVVLCSMSLTLLHAVEYDDKFKQYPAKPEKVIAKSLALDAQSKKYRTLFLEMSKQQFNFANHFVAETYGCGGGCSGLLVYNGKTGRGLLLKDQFSECYSEKHGFTDRDIFFEEDSRLIIAIGRRSGAMHKCEEVHYLIEKDQFKQIKQKWLYQ